MSDAMNIFISGGSGSLSSAAIADGVNWSRLTASSGAVAAEQRAALRGGVRKDRKRAVPLLPEVRHWAARDLEVRSTSDGSDTIVISGSPIVYDVGYVVYDMLGEFEERMLPGVASEILDGVDCRFLINHDGLPLARTTSGTMTLEDTPTELRFVATLDARQQIANDFAIAVERGDVSQMSCGFVVSRDEWNEDYSQRTVHGLRELLDVSGVTYPASPTTSIDVAKRMALSVPIESRSRIRRMAIDSRGGKVLSNANKEKAVDAIQALHEMVSSSGDDPNELLQARYDSGEVDTGGAVGDDGSVGGGSGGSGDPNAADDGSGFVGRAAPETAAERREASMSFGDQEMAVYEALGDRFGDVWVRDLGADWVVYECWGAQAGMYRLDYSMGDDMVCALADVTPQEVAQVTSFVPVERALSTGDLPKITQPPHMPPVEPEKTEPPVEETNSEKTSRALRLQAEAHRLARRRRSL